MPPRKSIEDKLDELDEISALPDRSAQVGRLEAALEHRHYRVVAKAAPTAAEALLYELVPALSTAYARFIEQGAKRDPSCFAKKALVRALVELDCDDADFYLEGLKCRQLEPVWGGTADTAADVRAGCAMGLVASGCSRALVEMTALLDDPEVQARAGAVRAIACGVPREAELLLRVKAMHGDPDPSVVAECRSDAALDWLVSIVADPRADPADDVLEALAAYKRNSRLTERLQNALAQRGDGQLEARFAELWRET